MTLSGKIHPHDVGLPEPAIRIRRRSRRVARIMLTIAVITAMPGWLLLFSRIKSQSPYQASVTLVLGLWYLLLAQVERVARIIESDETERDPARRLCGNCGWFFDAPDRFCRHCGKPLGASIGAPDPHAGGK
jgi:hypothetical protein